MSVKRAWVFLGFASSGPIIAAMAASGCGGDSGSRSGAGGTDAGVDATTEQDTRATPGTDSGAGADNSPPAMSGCTPMRYPIAPMGLVYNGGVPGQTCPTSLNPTNFANNYWFGYYDTAANDGGVVFTHAAERGGCDGPNSCGFHTAGTNIFGNGAGVGFTLAANNIFDATAKGFTGLQVWLRGTTSGTRGQGYAKRDNTVHVKLQTGLPDAATVDPRHYDDYGTYCFTQPPGDAGGGGDVWVVCPIPFTVWGIPSGIVYRDGYESAETGAPNPATDMFDPQNLVKIEFEFAPYAPPADSGVDQMVSFDLWIDDISFF